MPKQASYTNEALSSAIQMVKQGHPIYKAAIKYGIPDTSLRRKIESGENTVQDLSFYNYKLSVLTQQEEEQLYKWIVKCAESGHPRTSRQILKEASKISVTFPRKKYFPKGRASQQWLYRFIRRSSRLHGTKCVNISMASSLVTEGAIRSYHQRVDIYLKENGLQHILYYPHRVGNADETYLGFQPRQSVVYVGNAQRKGSKKSRTDPKTHLTVLYTVLANGKFLPSFIVYPYERVPAEIKKSYPIEGLAYGKSESGWMNKENFMTYLEHVVVKYLNDTQTERPFILFVDGHSSHLSLEVVEYCREQEIVLITLYPNSTWLLQPLDVGVFSVLKSNWDAFLLDKDEDFLFNLTNRNFAGVLKQFMDEKGPFLENFVKDAFKNTGIYPWNVEAIRFETMMESCRLRKDNPHKQAEIERTSEVGITFVDASSGMFTLTFTLF